MGLGVRWLEIPPGDIHSPQCLGESSLQCVPDPLQHSEAHSEAGRVSSSSREGFGVSWNLPPWGRDARQ